MNAIINNIVTKFIPLLLISFILIGVLTDFNAGMFVLEGVSGADAEDSDDVLEISGFHAQINLPPPPAAAIAPVAASAPGAAIAPAAQRSGPVISTSHTLSSFINPLTGTATATDISRNRPVAVSISNSRPALPSNATNGISQADIVYEFLVEGGITRFLGIYQDFTNVGVVGSIRSTRHYMAEIVEAYNAMFIHAGGSPLGFEEVDNRGITAFDSVRGRRDEIFTRNTNRVPGFTVENYHGMTTSGSAFSRWLPTYGLQLTHDNNFMQELNFTHNPIPNGVRAHRVNVKFSSGKDSTFNYNESQGLYYMSQFGSQFTDANNGIPVAFSNLLILDMPIEDLVGHGEGAGRQDMSTVGIGTGFFASSGRVAPIIWFRDNKSSQFIYIFENGHEIELAHGKTYIGLVPPELNTIFN